MLLLTHEKTVRYAQAQLAEGELLAGKAILDGVSRQLAKHHSLPPSVAVRRDALLACIAGIQEDLHRTRLSKHSKGHSNTTENA